MTSATHDQELLPDMRLRIPAWLRRPLPAAPRFLDTRDVVDALHLNTVCKGAKCPNMHECFSAGTATFLILGPNCTRNCAFCNIEPGPQSPPDPEEPARLAEAAVALKLKHVVITSVTRDDLPDGGAAHFAACIAAVQRKLPLSPVEVLIPDFQGCEKALNIVIDAQPDIINHNVETAPELYPVIRPQADFEQSLALLRRVRDAGPISKSGFMVGLGETDDQVRSILGRLAEAGCSIVTIGQYMQPSRKHPPVQRYVHPDRFEEYAEWGRALGICKMFSAPLVRSSYHAGTVHQS